MHVTVANIDWWYQPNGAVNLLLSDVSTMQDTVWVFYKTYKK